MLWLICRWEQEKHASVCPDTDGTGSNTTGIIENPTGGELSKKRVRKNHWPLADQLQERPEVCVLWRAECYTFRLSY